MTEEVRCPMCGKPNPPEEEVCIHCQARLKPLVVSPFSEEVDDGGGEMPDWLTRELEGKTDQLRQPSPPAAAEEETDGDMPDWLDSLRAEESDLEETPEDETPIDQAADLGLPDWLQADEAEAEEPAPEEEEALPDWLQQPEESPPPAEEAELPDWLVGVEEDDIQPPIILPDAEPETPEWPTEAEPAAEEPDWLASFEGVEIEAEEGGEAAALPELPSQVDLPPPDDLFELDDLGDLLEDLEEAESELDAEEEVVPTELPDWLEAMRPVDTMMEEEMDEEPPLQAGPLAGLRRVLPLDPDIARPRKAIPQPSRLQAGETQRKHARLLQELIETEGAVRAAAETLPITSQNLLRWIVTILLVLAVGIAVLNGGQVVPSLPREAVPPEIIHTSELISALPSQAHVLVAIEYEPATVGEMQAAAVPVLDHVMLKGAYLAFVSTSPTGPALANELVNGPLANHGYQSGVQFVNLGYIPGGASGLLGFAQTPSRLTPLSYDGLDAWALVPLDGITTLADFDLLLLISDNAETARLWIEQVKPVVPHTPLVLVSSAQAEPALRLYTGGAQPQVNGFVGGIFGGAAYEQMTGNEYLARDYWDGLTFGLIVAVVTIIIGGLVNAIRQAVLARGRRATT